MNRRAFITGMTGGLIAAPLAADAQQPGRYTIGVFTLGQAAQSRPYWDSLREGLRERGHVEGKGIAIEFRSAEEHVLRGAEANPEPLRAAPAADHERVAHRP
jgi:hypothetical protein